MTLATSAGTLSGTYSWYTIPITAYVLTGTALQINIYQNAAASGGTCSTPATYETRCTVTGPY